MSKRRVNALYGFVGCAAAVSLVLGVVCAVDGAKPAKPSSLTILYTSQAGGQIRSCNCTKFRYGGYGRQATLVAQVRKGQRNLLLIEGGDALGRPDVAQDKLKAGVSMKAMSVIGYSAVIPGEAEIRFGRQALEPLAKTAVAPFVMANAIDQGSGKPLFSKPFTVCKTADGLRVAVVGVLGPKILPKELLPVGSRVEVKDPAATLKSLLPKARAGADLVLVVCHATPAEAEAIAKMPGIDIVLCTHSDEKLVMPPKDGNAVDAEVSKLGSCTLAHSGTRFGWSLGRIDITLDRGKVKSCKHRLFYLDRAYDEDQRMVKVYDAYNKQVQDLTTSQDRKLRQQFEELMKKRGFDPSKSRRPKAFAGSAACKSCHESAFETWQKSRHARAFASLRKTKQEFDPECVRCHTTGMLVRGGFVNAKDTPELGDVQCEACHGPGAAHAAKPAKGYGATGEETCRGCHTEEFNPNFDYEQMWKEVAHQ